MQHSDMQHSDMQHSEHRHSPRIRSFLRGWIIHSNGASKTECTIRDMSDLGARIEAPSSVTVPEYFELFIPQKGTRHQVRIIWRHGAEIGVSFAQEAMEPGHGDDDRAEVGGKMAELEREVNKLRAQLAEMKSVVESLARSKQSA